MNTLHSAQRDLLSLKRHTLFAVLICYIPHITTEPWWLFSIFLAAAGYRLLADYKSYPLLPRWIRLFLIVGCLFILNQSIHTAGLPIRFLLVFIILKCIEIHSIRDIKALILCNFLLMFAALIVVQEFWIILYVLMAILVNLSIMLKLSAPGVTLSQIGSRSGKLLLMVIPLSLILFYVFPRLDPLWQTPSLAKASSGFSETMDIGSISQVFNDDSLVMQITFLSRPILNGYWQGIVLNYYNGESWGATWNGNLRFQPLRALKPDEIPDYEIMIEPSQTKWLFYDGYPEASAPSLLFLPNHGLVREDQEAPRQRFAYALKVRSTPYHDLTPAEYTAATQWPNHTNPRLNAWAKAAFENAHHDAKTFVLFLERYIHQQPFWYTLTPPPLNTSINAMDSFWFDTQKGFCEHYASAVTLILRAAGIPAHVMMGYQGGQWNAIAQTTIIQQNDAHAWLEYWQAGVGWQRFDPTAFIAPERIDQTIRDRQLERLNQEDYLTISTLPWDEQFRFYFDSVRIFAERWFLFYNPNTQKSLLQSLGLGDWSTSELLQASVGCIIAFMMLMGIGYPWWQKHTLDALLLEYHLLQKEFRRLQIATPPEATLKQQCHSLITKSPDLDPLISDFLQRYEELRLMQAITGSNKKATIHLFKSVRHALHQK